MTAKILTYIAPLNSNSQCPISNLKGIYNAKQKLCANQKIRKVLHTSDYTSKNSPTHKWNGKVKPIR